MTFGKRFSSLTIRSTFSLDLDRSLFFMWLVLMVFVSSLWAEDAPQTLHLLNGSAITYFSLEMKEDKLLLTIPGGQVTVPLSALDEKSRSKLIPPDATLPDRLPPVMTEEAPQLYTMQEGSFTIPSTLKDNPQLQFDYMFPVDAQGKRPDSASSVIFYAPPNFQGTMRSALHGKIQDRLVQLYGFTVFSAEIKASIEDINDRKACYYYPESGAFDSVWAAYDKLITDLQLPKRKIAVFGSSGGACMAQKFGLYYPDRTLVVGMLGGGFLDAPMTRSPCPYMHFATRGSEEMEENFRFADQAWQKNMNVLFAITPPGYKSGDNLAGRQGGQFFHHFIYEAGVRMVEQLFVDCLRMAQSGKDPQDLSQWPYYSEQTSLYYIRPNQIGSPPAEGRYYFSSWELVNLWQRIPYRIGLLKDVHEGNTARVWTRYPESADAIKGIVFVEELMNPDPNVGDDLDYWAGLGYIAIGAEFSYHERAFSRQAQAILDWVIEQPAWKDYGIYIAGLGRGGRHVILTACQSQNPRVLGAAAVVDNLEWPMEDLSPLAQASKLSLPLALVDMSGETAAPFLNITRSGHHPVVLLATVDKDMKKFGRYAQINMMADYFSKLPVPNANN